MSFQGRIQRALARTLTRAPFAIAYSGGGDSTALLHALRDRATFAVIVDHRLSEGSEARTRKAVARAETMGVETVACVWSDADRTSQQASARRARYGLIGEVLRERGVTQLLTGHTLTDAVETEMMSEGAAMIRPVTHAPVWPALLDIDVVRPMLGVSRAEVRTYLKREALGFIEDPANDDTRFARVRARATVTADHEVELQERMEVWRDRLMAEAEAYLQVLPHVLLTETGGLHVPSGTPPSLFRFALACAAGGDRLAPLSRVEAVMELDGTLAGAKVTSVAKGWRLERDPGAVLGREGVEPVAPRTLSGRECVVWDGRFRIRSPGEDVTVRAKGGHGPRATLPVLDTGESSLSPLDSHSVLFEPLALSRLQRIVAAQLRCG